MGVKLRTQSVVAVVVLRVACLLHGAKQHHVEDIGIRFILDPLHKVLKGVLADRAGRTVNRQTKASRIVDELLQLVRLRILVDPIDERQVQLGKMLSNALIGRQHEGLYHSLGNAPLTQLNIDWQTILVDDDFGFSCIKVESPTLIAHGFQRLMEFDHELNTWYDCLVFFQLS